MCTLTLASLVGGESVIEELDDFGEFCGGVGVEVVVGHLDNDGPGIAVPLSGDSSGRWTVSVQLLPAITLTAAAVSVGCVRCLRRCGVVFLPRMGARLSRAAVSGFRSG